MGYKIGITIGLQTEGEDFWVNGIKQNAYFLATLFSNSTRRHEVFILNTTEIEPTDRIGWSLNHPQTRQFKDFDEPLDILIALGGALSQHQVDHWRQKGCKVIAYKCGAEYVMSTQSIIFNRPLGGPPHFVQNLDGVWMIPQVAVTTLAYHEVLHRCRVTVVPFVWGTSPLEQLCKTMPNRGHYVPSAGAKRVSVLEPNIDVLKFCLYPIFATELVYRQQPQSLRSLAVLNSAHLKENKEFFGLMQQLDIVKSGLASFETRHQTAWFLNNHTDIVISHQWALPLNYAYLETCWLGYPFIHNAELCADIGYYYHENSISDASNLLAAVIENHDRHHETYLLKQRKNIARYLCTCTETIEVYDLLLSELVNS